MADFKVITSDFVRLHISTSKDDVSFEEKRFPKDITISDLKAKLELITGGNCNTMQIEAYNKDNKHICSLSNNEALLGSYPLDDGMRLHVIDQFNIRNELDFGDVPKYELPEEEYNKKTDSVKAFLMKNKMGQYNEENIKKKEKQMSEEKQLAESTPIGSRCKVTVANAPCRLGTVMYTGPVETLPGYWIGVKYDEPLGKNDGTFKGKKYFECANNYGAFVKPHNVECGDFPEEDYDLNEEI
ncbi:tubulin-folding cofactor B [Tribolium castaneum]|uniref:Tubulin-folding cofactor B-like Protein n=1 Tax=Tribolium castaneum TaxID=7070 RepID=D6WA48_TRICA|nr:PREDICTED: tubulin-folding cofactor B [Tribolium castaneum]EEZ98061.1 Tubulin-folding cofactor B-like Protein [Tribolium castaneum]|eukprot:XP_968339.1 PREDICTED: tubulin-folding cofactor B [Tribolium castaneum]